MDPFKFTAQNLPHDYHSPISLTLSEAEDAGFFNLDTIVWNYHDGDQKKRVISMIRGRYSDMSLGVLPVTRWLRMFTNRLNELMARYEPLYKRISQNDFDWMGVDDEYGKERHIYSDFPQTLLNGENQDYASTGDDREHELRHMGDNMEKYIRYTRAVEALDVLVTDGVESMFSSLMAVNINAF